MGNKRFLFSTRKKHLWHLSQGKARRLDRIFNAIRYLMPEKKEVKDVADRSN